MSEEIDQTGQMQQMQGMPQDTQDTQERQQVTLDPAKILYEVDVHMDASVLYDYMLRHTYTGMQGLVATLLGVMCILFFAQGAGVIYLIAGVIIIVYLPWNLFLSAKRQALGNEAFKKPLHYAFTEDGIYVSQGESMEMQRWDAMYQAVATSKSIIVYTSKVNASVFPRRDLGDDTAVLIGIICRHMNPKKVKIRQ